MQLLFNKPSHHAITDKKNSLQQTSSETNLPFHPEKHAHAQHLVLTEMKAVDKSICLRLYGGHLNCDDCMLRYSEVWRKKS